MKHITSRLLAVFLLTLLSGAGCNQTAPPPGLTQANYDQVSIGMSKEQVEKLLGPPTRVENKQALVFAAESKWEPITTYHYEDGKKSATITFKNDQVDGKDSSLGQEP